MRFLVLRMPDDEFGRALSFLLFRHAETPDLAPLAAALDHAARSPVTVWRASDGGRHVATFGSWQSCREWLTRYFADASHGIGGASLRRSVELWAGMPRSFANLSISTEVLL